MGKLTISMAIFNSYVSHNQRVAMAFNRGPRHELREQFVQLTAAAAFAGDGEALAAEEILAARWPAEVADGPEAGRPRPQSMDWFNRKIYGFYRKIYGLRENLNRKDPDFIGKSIWFPVPISP